MSEFMVFERPPKRDLSYSAGPKSALRIVQECFMFRSEQEIKEDETRFVTVWAKTDESDLPPEPILQEDFFADTLNPIIEKGKHLLGGRKPLLKSHTFDGSSLVFIFSAG